jgi:hypothetical protein
VSSHETDAAKIFEGLVAALTAEQPTSYFGSFRLKDSAAGGRLLEESPETQAEFLMRAVRWLEREGGESFDYVPYSVRTAVTTLLRRRLPLGHDEVLELLGWSARRSGNYWRVVPQMIKAVEDYLKENPLTDALREKIAELVGRVGAEHETAESRRWVVRLRELCGDASARLPIRPGEAWSDAAISEIESAGAEERAAWLELLGVCERATGSAPTKKWSKAAAAALEKLGRERFRAAALRWFPLVDRPRTQPIQTWAQWMPDPNGMIEAGNADLLRALVWLCAAEEDREVARALTALAVSAYRKVPGVGPRCVRVGNACVWALGRMPGAAGVEQLALLKLKVKFGAAQKGVESALAEAARRWGLPPGEIEEMAVPAYGLREVGLRRESLGEYTAEVVAGEGNSVELSWRRADGRPQRSTPQAIKERHADELKELSQSVRDIRKMLPAQAERIEGLYLERRAWPLPVWRERYLDHPLVGVLARRLVWNFLKGGEAVAGVFAGGEVVGRDGEPLRRLDETTSVELWHPIRETPEAVTAWRDLLAARGIVQPFKQAHREVYLLTDAERATRVYSNRFAAHVIRQHQFNALCAARGWRNKLRLLVDDEYPPATRHVAAWGLRAEFWVEGVGENYGTDTTEAGTFLHLTTDQVRFYPSAAPQRRAHAGGGGYYLDRLAQGAAEPLALDQVPPLVFSEIMRDVDLFVGVASVANDPNWADGGPEGRYRDYWESYSFGDLSETAKTRRAVLDRLVPRLKIADRCRLTDKFLVVRGDLRAYKIHLGSGNVLMEPNDQYLCVVPARGAANGGADGKVFLPFEGDNTLAIILSKAFLLAEDRKITDPTIVRQIGA